MKIIEEKHNKVIVLREGEEITVKTLYKNKVNIQIKCKDHSLYVLDIEDKRLKQIKTEQEQLNKLKDLIK